KAVLVQTGSLVLQTFFYGKSFYDFDVALLIIRSFRQRGVKGRAGVTLFVMTIFMFILCSAYWAVSVAHCAFSILAEGGVSRPTPYTLMNALVLINYVLADGVVVWRAWILCREEYERLLRVPWVLLFMMSLSVLATIGLRLTIIIFEARDPNHPLLPRITSALDIAQVASIVFSLSTNIFATAIVAMKYWHYRRWIWDYLKITRKERTHSESVLVLLVESGVVYCISGVILQFLTLMFALPFGRIFHGTLGDIYTPTQVQIAGVYPTIVLLIVTQQRSLTE
ncbi:hypothetical protein C8J56DRAFT_709292, partial [Mycena floridula]